MAIQETTSDAIRAAREALRSAPPKARPKTISDALKELRGDLLKARSADYSYDEISEMLGRIGVHASASAIERAIRTKRSAGARASAQASAARAAPQSQTERTSGRTMVMPDALPDWQRP